MPSFKKIYSKMLFVSSLLLFAFSSLLGGFLFFFYANPEELTQITTTESLGVVTIIWFFALILYRGSRQVESGWFQFVNQIVAMFLLALGAFVAGISWASFLSDLVGRGYVISSLYYLPYLYWIGVALLSLVISVCLYGQCRTVRKQYEDDYPNQPVPEISAAHSDSSEQSSQPTNQQSLRVQTA